MKRAVRMVVLMVGLVCTYAVVATPLTAEQGTNADVQSSNRMQIASSGSQNVIQ